MTHRGLGFLRDWIEDNMSIDHALGNDPHAYVAKCLADAAREGISRKAIEEDTGSIEERILEAMKEAAADSAYLHARKDN
jgi:hypothetical protein